MGHSDPYESRLSIDNGCPPIKVRAKVATNSATPFDIVFSMSLFPSQPCSTL